ncbi:unnamed protein product [Acanthoscelides obtectus]|uniref:Uncharacterized protein n=3 Tax=Acanthoscelides obtectus TaxID=200917 RepID=A0A9P0K813_ACAOB|nr:unnamed protein product [Acanthoscelides obtectus]CAK1647990.1 hypothetical protein AOBTE_LOCUS15490 [Acanthoscelides obtectus]
MGMGGMGMGGFGGGWGGYGGGYMQKRRGFFSGGSTFGNILTGMMIYHLGSSLIGGMFRHKPYNVYNYYNMPPEAKQEIKMPSNVLMLCEGNATNFCAQGTTSICTTNGTVLCVATMTNAVPCTEEKTLCVNATMTCPDKNDPICKNLTKGEDKATLPVPCLTNLIVDVNLLNETNVHGQNGHDYKYCVTQLAVAGPEYRNCTEKDLIGSTMDYKNILNENATKLCAPGLVPVCTTYKEIMCLETLTETKFCEQFNTTCVQSPVPCGEDLEARPWCAGNKSNDELVEKDGKKHAIVQIPCFANITVNSNLPNFEIHEFNGTLPEGQNTSIVWALWASLGP